jgi:hypothetical protein
MEVFDEELCEMVVTSLYGLVDQPLMPFNSVGNHHTNLSQVV